MQHRFGAIASLLFACMLGAGAHAAPRAAAVPPPDPCGPPRLPAHADAIDQAIVRAMREGHIPGLSVVVIDRGAVVKQRSYGFADLESCAPATEDTLFGIGSISKQLAAVGALTLVRDGALSLDDPITKYLPEGKGVWDEIRVRHLLNHTSGIPDYTGDDDQHPSITLDRASSPSTAELVRQIAKARLNFRPGDDWAYSNTGYVLLGVLIERVGHQPFSAFMHDHVFAPLGMTATRFYSPLALIPHRGTPYHVAADGTVTHGPFISEQFSHWGDMGILSTARDMGRWANALGKDRLLPAALWHEMLAPARLNDGTLFDYGFGVELEQIGNQRLWIHAGTFRVGYSAMFLSLPERQLAVAMLSNHYGEPLRTLELATRLAGMREPTIAPSVMRRPRSDAPPRLTAALFQRLRGADEAHGAIALTPAFARHAGRLRPVQQAFTQLAVEPGALRFYGCTAVTRAPAEAFGVPVARGCLYRVEGHPDLPGFQLWLTAHDELAGITFW